MCCSLVQFNVVSAETSLFISATSPGSAPPTPVLPLSTSSPLHRLPSPVFDFKCTSVQGLLCHKDNGFEDRVRKAWVMDIGWVKGLWEAKWGFLAIKTMHCLTDPAPTLPGLQDKAEFLKSLQNQVSVCLITLTLPLFSQLLCISTNTFNLHKDTRFPHPYMFSYSCLFLHGHKVAKHGKTTLQWQQRHKCRGSWRPRSRCSQRYAGAHGKASEPQLHSPAWPANAQGEKHLRNWLGMKVKQHYSHPQKQMAISR